MHKKIEHKKLNFDENVRLNNIDAWKTIPAFDYDNWQETTKAKLMKVNWDANYLHTVDWTLTDRDTYLDNKDGVDLDDLHNLKFTTTTVEIKINKPMQDISDYNYLVVDDQAEPVSGSSGRRLCYFIEEVVQLSPNAIQLKLQLDVWTTYMTDTIVKQVMLRRGHKPVVENTPENFLANPMENVVGITNPEQLVGELTRIAKKWESEVDGHSSYVAFYATTDPVTNVSLTGPVWFVIDFKQGNLSDFSSWLDIQNPKWYNNIMYMASLPEYFLVKDNPSYESDDWDIYIWFEAMNGRSSFWSATVVKDDFGYPDLYKNITKLYTKQYAEFNLQLRQSGAGDYQENLKLEDVGSTIDWEERVHTLAGAATPALQVGQRVKTATKQVLARWDSGMDDIACNREIVKRATEANQIASAHNQNDINLANTLRSNQTSRDDVSTNVDRRNETNTNDNGLIYFSTETQKEKIAKNVALTNNKQDADFVAYQAGAVGTGVVSIVSSLVQAGSNKGSNGISSGISTGASLGIAITQNETIKNNQKDFNSTVGIGGAVGQEAIEKTYLDEMCNAQQDNNNLNVAVSNAKDIEIADRDKTTADANANDTHSATNQSIEAPYRDARCYNDTYPSGGGQIDTFYMRERGNVKLKTAPLDVITRAGNEMLRYGYYHEDVITNPTLSITPKYTYWQCNDIMVENEHNETVNNALKAIFIYGTTIYRNPDDCQRVALSENKW